MTINDEEFISSLPPEAQRRILENRLADQLVDRMEREFDEEYLVKAGWIAGGLLVILGKYSYDLINNPESAKVFQTHYAPITIGTAGWWAEIEKEVTGDCNSEEQIARVIKRMCERMAGTIFSNACPPSRS